MARNPDNQKSRAPRTWVPKPWRKRHQIKRERKSERTSKEREIQADPTKTETLNPSAVVKKLPQALEQLSRFKEHIFKRDGFLVDSSKPTTAEVRRFIGEFTVTEYQNRFSNMICHDICQTSNPMPRVRSLLGQDFNFFLQKPTLNMNITKTNNRLRYDMRHINFSRTKWRSSRKKKGDTPEDSTSSPTESLH